MSNFDPEIDAVPLRQAVAALVPEGRRRHEPDAKQWLIEQLASGALVAFGRRDRVSGSLVRINADAWRGTVYVHGSHPGRRSNGELLLDKGSAFFWTERAEFYDVRISRAAAPRPAEDRIPSSSGGSDKAKRGPKPGEVDRFGEADRALYPDLDRMIAEEKVTITAAARRLADQGRIDGVGSPHSRATRLAARYRRECGPSNGPGTKLTESH